MQEAGAAPAGPGRLMVHQFTPAQQGLLPGRKFHVAEKSGMKTCIIVSSVASTSSIWEERLSTVACDLLRNWGISG